MTAGKSAKADQRTTGQKAAEYARGDKAPDLEGAGGEKDSEVVQSAVAALGAAVFGAGVGEEEERERARKRGLHMDMDDNDRDEIPGVSGRQASREPPAKPQLTADELEREYREGRPGGATARQADPNAAPTPLQRLEEDDDLN